MNIEFIIPTYNRTDLLMTCISSIVAQTNPNWKIRVVADGPDEDTKEKLSWIANYYEEESRIKWTVLDQRYNDWGHTPRQIGLDNATEEWVIMTGEDNYYVPEFVDIMLNEGTNQHFVYCDMVHNWINKEYIPVKTKLNLGAIDIGCFMAKTNLAQKIKLQTTEEWADWYFVQEFMNKFKHAKMKKVNKILYVHN
jgi:glycosyltransferase involved in cell wall biosynthesis